MKSTKLMINCPEIELLGGVSNHYQGLHKHWSFNVRYCFTGSRKHISGIFFFPFDIFKFFFKILIFRPNKIILNPSLQFKSLNRDFIFLLFAKLLKIETTIFIHGWDKKVEKKIDKSRFYYQRILNMPDKLIVLSSSFKKKLISWKVRKNIYLTTTKVSDDLIENFSLNNKPYDNSLLFLSRVERNKGIFEVIDTFEILSKEIKNLSLTVAGDGSDLKNAKTYAKSKNLKNIKFTGRVSGNELIDVFTNHSIYFFPTRHGEGMPTSVLEAMAFGMLIITMPVGGIVDFFENEKMGKMIKENEPLVFSDHIKFYLNNKNNLLKISSYNHQYAKKHFLASNVTSAIENILLNI